MAEIEYSESDGARRVEYYDEDNECLNLRVYTGDAEFACFWTPKLAPFVAFNHLRKLGFISLRSADGLVEWADQTLETPKWMGALVKAQQVGLQNLTYLRVGSDVESIILERSPFGTGFCCGLGGEIDKLHFLGTALTLTASRSLIVQYSAMRSRLIGSRRQEYRTTIKR
ncbi:MAG: hypothetical protein NVSMB39_2600 [Candidatus Saccharimonadales bacterium]